MRHPRNGVPGSVRRAASDRDSLAPARGPCGLRRPGTTEHTQSGACQQPRRWTQSPPSPAPRIWLSAGAASSRGWARIIRHAVHFQHGNGWGGDARRIARARHFQHGTAVRRRGSGRLGGRAGTRCWPRIGTCPNSGRPGAVGWRGDGGRGGGGCRTWWLDPPQTAYSCFGRSLHQSCTAEHQGTTGRSGVQGLRSRGFE